MKRILISISTLFIVNLVYSQNFGWVKTFGGSAHDAAYGFTVDSFGNIYVVGHFSDTVDFDPGPGVMSLISAGNNDIFVVKMDDGGNLIWVYRFGGASFDQASSATTDQLGNVIITGYFSDTVDFDPGPGVQNLEGSSQSMFILKLDALGNFVWADLLSGSGNNAMAIKTDAFGNIYLGGYFYGTVDFDPGAGSFPITYHTAGSPDAFVTKYNSGGQLVWAKNFGGSGSASGFDVSVDLFGNVVLCGSFMGTVDFDPGVTNDSISSSVGANDVFICKLDSSGNYDWATKMGGPGHDAAYTVTTDNVGNVISAGRFYYTADFDPGMVTYNLVSGGSSDCFISKLDPSGAFVAAYQFAGPGANVINSIYLDDSMNIYTTGTFDETVDFDPSAGVYNLVGVSSGVNDGFVSKLYSNGGFGWAKSFGGNGSDNPSTIFVDDSANVFTAGYFQATCDFDPGAGTYNQTSNGGLDVFILKMLNTNLSAVEEVNGSNIVVFPNPFQSQINFYGIDHPTKITLNSVIGEQIGSWIIDPSYPQIEIVGLSPGVYFLNGCVQSNTFTKKIIKE